MSTSGMKYIRDYYRVPCNIGEPIAYKGKNGVVTGSNGPHVMARLDGERQSRPYHPDDLTWLNVTGTKP